MYSRIQRSFQRQGFLQTLGAELVSVAEGEVTLQARLGPGMTQQHGAGHAGVSFTLGDVAAGYAALTVLDPGVEVMTSEMKIHLLRPTVGEAVIARGSVIKPGRRLVITRAEIYTLRDGEEIHTATMLGTMVPVSETL